jgi:hypothetical protein
VSSSPPCSPLVYRRGYLIAEPGKLMRLADEEVS